MRLVPAALAAALLATGCAQTRYAQFARFTDAEAPEDDPFTGCLRAFRTPTQLEVRCPNAHLVVDDRLRKLPYDSVRRWAEDEEARQRRALAGLDHAQVRLSLEELSLPDGSPWPFLRAISLAGPDGLTPVEDVWLVRAPYDRDGVREMRCAATNPLGADRCARLLPALLARTPPADLPSEESLFEGCESARFPLHKVRGATRTSCRYLRLIEHDRSPDLPRPQDLARAFDVPSASVKAERLEVPRLSDDGPAVDVAGFALTVNDRVVWSGVLARDRTGNKLAHCGAELPPALGLRHCYRAVLIRLTGDDQLEAVSPGG